MKRILCTLLCLAILASSSACMPDADVLVDPVDFYYPRAELDDEDYFGENAVLVPEPREAAGHRDDLEYLLQLYLAGPLDEALTPFPSGTSLMGLYVGSTEVFVSLSEEYAQLSGISLTLANACVSMTILEILADSNFETVYLSASGALMDGETQYQISRSDLMLIDDSVDKLQDNLVLYLTDSAYTRLYGETVTINITSGNSACAALLEMLLESTEDSDLISPLPEGTQLLGFGLRSGLCTVNFSSEFETNIPQSASVQYLILQSITNTLTQLTYVDSVSFYCAGSQLSSYGAMDTSEAWVWDQCSVFSSTDQDANAVTIYLPTGASTGLVPIQLNLEPKDNVSRAEQVLSALLEYQPSNGFLNPIPSGTGLNQVTIADGLCTVDLSEEFLSQPDMLETAVHAVVATASSLDSVTSVQITVEGSVPTDMDLFNLTTPDPLWFA